MKLYHGTDLESAINIEKNGIDVFFNCDRRGDFGPGFYNIFRAKAHDFNRWDEARA